MRLMVSIRLLLGLVLAGSPAVAHDADTSRSEWEQARRQVEAIKDQYENSLKTLRALEERIRQMEAVSTAAGKQPLSASPGGRRTETGAVPATSPGQTLPSLGPHFSPAEGLTLGDEHGFRLRLGANIDLLGALRNFGPSRRREELTLREIELALEAQVTPWLDGFIFLTRPDGETVDLEEAAATAHLPWDLQLRAGKYRVEFGYLNTVHEPERPQVSIPLPVVEFLGDEQLRETALTVGRLFDLGSGHRAGLSVAIWNGDNEVALNEARTGDKAFAAKLYSGFASAAFAYQVGVSAFTGKNDAAGRRTTSAQALDLRWFLDPGYNKGYDYPSRISLLGEAIFSQREIGEREDVGPRRNNALGTWLVADYQFLPSHHLGLGAEYAQGRLDRRKESTAYSAHYSWYYSPHSRVQLQARRVEAQADNGGWELNLQWNIVLGPHSERPLLPILPFEVERWR